MISFAPVSGLDRTPDVHLWRSIELGWAFRNGGGTKHMNRRRCVRAWA